LLSVLVHFFEHGRWGSPVETAVEEQNLTAEDQLFILMQAGLRIAKEQKSVSLGTRAETTYAEYRRHQASGSEERSFRLPLW